MKSKLVLLSIVFSLIFTNSIFADQKQLVGADVDYGEATAFTTYGSTGIKAWIFKGEVMEHDPMAQDKKMGNFDKGSNIKSID